MGCCKSKGKTADDAAKASSSTPVQAAAGTDPSNSQQQPAASAGSTPEVVIRCKSCNNTGTDFLGQPCTCKFAKQSKVKVHVGPLEVGPDGVAIKPKFNLGITGSSVYAMAGVQDVRDGVKVEAYAQTQKSYSSSGSSLVEILENIKAEEKVPVLDTMIEAMPDTIAAVLDLAGVDLKQEKYEAEGVVYIYVGAGVTAGVYLGWLDTQQYHMAGVEGRVAAAASVGMSVRAGLHKDRKAIRIIMYLNNVGFDVIAKLKNSVPQAAE